MREARDAYLYKRAQDARDAGQKSCETAQRTYLELQQAVHEFHENILAVQHQLSLDRVGIADHEDGSGQATEEAPLVGAGLRPRDIDR